MKKYETAFTQIDSAVEEMIAQGLLEIQADGSRVLTEKGILYADLLRHTDTPQDRAAADGENRRCDKKTADRLTEQASAYITAHYLEKFSLDQIAGALHINKNHLARTFKRVTGTTLLAFHNEIRCQKAKELLEETTLPVTVIAGQTGFGSPAHFSHVFQRVTGMTPTACRRTCQK